MGFYRYEQDSKGKPRKVQDEQTAALLAEVAPSNAQFSDEEIIARMMIPMINEVVRCFEEKIVSSPAEADMALVYGIGFPPFHGGAFRYLDTIGTTQYVEMAQRYQHLGELYQVPAGLRAKAETNAAYYPAAAPIETDATMASSATQQA